MRKKAALASWILILSCDGSSEVIGTFYDQTLIKPFGYIHSRRPPAGVKVVSLDDIKLEFSARQVCGYTDWSSAVISLPKKILSTEYWRNVGNDIKTQAINSVLAISGALPSMLACNASPTFCSILNRAEALAQANLKFTFDSCQVLDGLSDVTKSHFEPLKSCVRSEVQDKNKGASEALDSCTVGNHDPENRRQKDRYIEAKNKASSSYKSRDLDQKLCRESTHPRYSSSSHAYSISEFSCKWMKEFFPGISLEAGSKFRHGGTFSNSPGEDLYDSQREVISVYIVDLLDLIHALRYGLREYASIGPQPRHIVISHKEAVWLIRLQPKCLKG